MHATSRTSPSTWRRSRASSISSSTLNTPARTSRSGSNGSGAVCTGNRADAGKLPYRLSGTGTAQFEFDCPGARARHPARLRIHTSDQSELAPTVVQIAFDGRRLQQTLPKGLGIQRTDPAHRAYPATVEFDLAGSELRKKSNTLTVSIAGDGWFAWDALELVSKPQTSYLQEFKLLTQQ